MCNQGTIFIDRFQDVFLGLLGRPYSPTFKPLLWAIWFSSLLVFKRSGQGLCGWAISCPMHDLILKPEALKASFHKHAEVAKTMAPFGGTYPK